MLVFGKYTMKLSVFCIASVIAISLGTIAMNTPSAVAEKKRIVKVIAHRGASAYAPENTVVAFERAAALGADYFELDCTLSKDDEIIVIHDDTINRTTDFKGRVKDLTLKEIKRYDAGSWFSSEFGGERIPTLDEALDVVDRHIGVYIEIKNSDDDRELEGRLLKMAEDNGELLPSLSNEVMELIEASKTRNLTLTRKVIQNVRDRRLRRRVVLQSFSPVVCAVALIEAPEIRTELLAYDKADDLRVWARYGQWVRYLDPKGFNLSADRVTRELVREMHDAGRTVAVWTVDDEADMRAFARMGVDAIITNYPDVCIEVLKRIGY